MTARPVYMLTNQGFGDDSVDEIIAKQTNLGSDTLDLRGNQLGERGGGALADRLLSELPGVKHIILSGNEVEDRGAVQLAQAKTEIICFNAIHVSSLVCGEQAVAEGDACNLVSIQLASNRISDWGASTLGEALAKTCRSTVRTWLEPALKCASN